MAADKKKVTKRPTALKRNIQSEKRRLLNRQHRSQVRTAIRSIQELIAKKEGDSVPEKLNFAYSLIDRAVKKGIFKLNKAARMKSKLAAKAHKI